METLIKGELVYVAGPYTAYLPSGQLYTNKIEQRMYKMSQAAMALAEAGFHPVSPLYMHYVMKDADSGMSSDWAAWSEYSQTLLRKCDKLVVLKIEGWDKSTGVQEEIRLAKEYGIPVIYLNWDAAVTGFFEDEGNF